MLLTEKVGDTGVINSVGATVGKFFCRFTEKNTGELGFGELLGHGNTSESGMSSPSIISRLSHIILSVFYLKKEKGHALSPVTPCFYLARLEGFEPPTHCLEGGKGKEGELGKSCYSNILSNAKNAANADARNKNRACVYLPDYLFTREVAA